VSIIAKYSYAEEIKHRKFGKVALLVQKGDISTLNQEELNLLADYLENSKGKRGSPKKDHRLLSE